MSFVSIPSEFTLLSNIPWNIPIPVPVSIPSEFTLLSNNRLPSGVKFEFQYPLNLHCSQTGKLHTL